MVLPRNNNFFHKMDATETVTSDDTAARSPTCQSGISKLDTADTQHINITSCEGGSDLDTQGAQKGDPVISVPIFCVKCQRERHLYEPLTAGIRCSKGLSLLIGGNGKFPPVRCVLQDDRNTQLLTASNACSMEWNNYFKLSSFEEPLSKVDCELLSFRKWSLFSRISGELGSDLEFDPMFSGDLEYSSKYGCHEFLEDNHELQSYSLLEMPKGNRFPHFHTGLEMKMELHIKRGIYSQTMPCNSLGTFCCPAVMNEVQEFQTEFSSDYAISSFSTSYANSCHHQCTHCNTSDVMSAGERHKTKVELGNSRPARKLDSAYSSLERQTQPLYVRGCNISLDRRSFDGCDTCTVVTSDDTDTDSGTEDTSDTDDTSIVYRPTKSCTKEKLQHRTREMLQVLKEHHVRLIQAVSEQLVHLLQERHELREQVEMRKIAVEQLLRFKSHDAHVQVDTAES